MQHGIPSIIFGILLVYSLDVYSMPSMSTYKNNMESQSQETSYALNVQEKYYAQQYVPVAPAGIPKDISQFDENPKVNNVPQIPKKSQKAITSSVEVGDIAEGTKAEKITSNNNGQKTEDAFVIDLEPPSRFLPPSDSIVPRLTGTYIKSQETKAETFNGLIINPSAYYLEGLNIENVKSPTCKMVGCDGPVPNDYDFYLEDNNAERRNQACHQTFVPLNSCVDKRGYPVGMVCTICCDCTNDFVSEMKKSRGYLDGYKTK